MKARKDNHLEYNEDISSIFFDVVKEDSKEKKIEEDDHQC